ncbi:MAG TPA: hypothetical protein VNQ76_17685 [Planctomicrobium sp.]|nr:hypothetical protein [Planctomicrobium sp.]
MMANYTGRYTSTQRTLRHPRRQGDQTTFSYDDGRVALLRELHLCAMLASPQQGEYAMGIPIPFAMLMLLTRHEHDTH